jgi:predicted DNA binding CopG/RHH family protein
MNYNLKLESEEQELLNSYERDEWRSVDKLQERLRQYQAFAIAALEAMGLVSIALPQEDLKAIREKAAAAGMSYQTLIANVIHQYVTGSLVEKPRSA